MCSTPNSLSDHVPRTSEEASELLSENKALRRRLEEALLRLEGYEIMGDILQEEYGIDLLKKIRSRTVQRLKERHTAMSLSFSVRVVRLYPSAYYKHLRRNREGSLSDTLLLERVGYYRKLMPRLGGRKLWHLLQQDGFPVSRDRLFTLLSENNLLVKRRKKYSVTTCSRHWMRKYPNLIRGFDLERPHRLWVGDITYIFFERRICIIWL